MEAKPLASRSLLPTDCIAIRVFLTHSIRKSRKVLLKEAAELRGASPSGFVQLPSEPITWASRARTHLFMRTNYTNDIQLQHLLCLLIRLQYHVLWALRWKS